MSTERLNPGVRIAVIGISGAGKTTMARELAARLGVPHIELDALNWRPGWHGLNRHDPLEFIRIVEEALAADNWIADGHYGLVRDLLWRRATHLIWLDYERPVVMARAIRRSLSRVVTGQELWPGTGNRERWTHLLAADHPIRWSWRTFAALRRQTGRHLASPVYGHLNVRRVRKPKEARGVLEALVAEIEGMEIVVPRDGGLRS